MSHAQVGLAFCFLTALGCSPTTGVVGDGGLPEDFSAVKRDLGTRCEPPLGSVLANADFETLSTQAADGNGQAKNTGSPASTLPSWDGCCNQASGGTTWTVSQAMPRCGGRSVAVVSSGAMNNVLNQTLELRAQAGKNFLLSGWAFVSQGTGSATVRLDAFNLDTGTVITASAALSQTTADWIQLIAEGKVPPSGRVQARITSTGTLTATLDDLSLIIE